MSVQGVPDMRRAPQMRRPYKDSLASTVASQSSDHVLARGVPRGVAVVVCTGFLHIGGSCPSIDMRSVLQSGWGLGRLVVGECAKQGVDY